MLCQSANCLNPSGMHTELRAEESYRTGRCSYCRSGGEFGESEIWKENPPTSGLPMPTSLVGPQTIDDDDGYLIRHFQAAEKNVEVKVGKDGVYLSQAAIADMFGVSRSTLTSSPP